MSITIFWLSAETVAACEQFGDTELTSALARCESLRRQGMRHVTISSELEHHVGKAGVDTIVDGKTPDGHDYTWKKRHV
jgi:hypothetical protein